MVDLYRQLKGKHPFGGIFQFMQPVALITDPAMVRNVTVRDFRHFYDRGGFTNAAHDPLSGSLLNGEGKRWSTIRQATVPVFATGKLKAIHPVMVQLVDRFRVALNEQLLTRGGEKVELKHWVARLTMSIAGGVLLGIDGNCLNDIRDEGLYGQMGRKTFLVPKLWELFLMTSFRPVAKKIGLRLHSPDLCELFRQMTNDIIGYRKAHPELRRNDLVDRLLKLTEKTDSDGGLSESEIVANVYIFFTASYEATSTIVTFCLYELAQQPDVQERARNCALESRAKYGELTYDSLSDMPYIDQCLNETLRKYPSGINMIRVVTEDYAVPDSEVVLPKGLHVIIPVYAIHHDAEYYPDPERFDPERFSPEAYAARKPYTFLAFGEGPKICIAHRLGRMQLRLIVASLLCSYRFECCPETPLGRSTAHSVIMMNDGFLVKVRRIE
uniref:Uncharacterized protein n=1 Tax=Anopheles atroparvus TaxID=41427 RepID=A0A182INB4_ANOAO